MNFFEVLNIVLVAVGKAVFSIPFIMITGIVYFLINKSKGFK